ncbi:hypothetical protein [Saccharothrix australiensis]|uniref:Uncharacterized protein n=1 Tax=Saccharothrix australiensis TaxID=2072 RepID=A0A495W0G9_9PSEU|nr:hypothetical protein [Saccharothrix australiensis]RKT54507.1 hypothetical protein C8E97_3150 [Saccharothrix australiensis]
MTTSRSTSRGSRKRTGIIGYLGNIVDDTKEYLDDVLDRGHEIDHDLRRTTRRAFRGEDDTADDVAALREELDELAGRLEELAGAQAGTSSGQGQSAQGQQKKGS